MAKLSLTARKNIKENEPKIEAAIKKMAKVTGFTFEHEVDWLAVSVVADEKGYKDRCGEIFVWYMDGLASNVEKFCGDAIQKESFIESFSTAHRLAFIIVEAVDEEDTEHQYSYVWTRNNNGSLEMVVPKPRFCSNVNDAGSDLSKTCSSSDGPLNVATRKNIKDHEAKRLSYLKAIKTNTGIEFDLEIDWASFAETSKERGYADRAGEICNWYLEGLSDNIKTFAADPIQKESFIESFKDRKSIAFVVVPEVDEEDKEHQYAYVWTRNDGGVLTLVIPKARFCSNVNDAGKDLSKTTSGDGPLNVATRKNIKDHEAKRLSYLKAIKTNTGIEFDTEIDWVVFAETSKERGYADRAGEICNWYLEGLSDNIKTFVTDPIQKESFVEAFGERKSIVFVVIPEVDEEDKEHQYSYVFTRNDGGVLNVIIPKTRFCSNVNDTGRDLAKTCSGEGPMSVLTRKNIKDQEPNRVKHMKRISKATGIDFDIEIDWAAFAALAKERGYEDRVGEIIYSWYLDGLAGNLEKLCKDDMCKEAVGEACEKKSIAFAIVEEDQMEGRYCKATFESGVLTISVSKNRFCSNVNDCGGDIESRL